MKSIKELQVEVYQSAVDRGFHSGDNNVWKMLGNIHGEVSEAWEEARKPEFDPTHVYYSRKAKPEGFPTELADIVIRVLDTAEAFGIDLEAAIMEKMDFNKTRPFRHGNKRA